MTLMGLAALLAEQADWQEHALCAQTFPDAFFPEKGGSTREAKQVCLACEVKAQCLAYALENQERFGVWGGLSERERRRLQSRGGAGVDRDWSASADDWSASADGWGEPSRRPGPPLAQLSDANTAAALELFRQGLSLKAVRQQLRCSQAALRRLQDQYLMNRRSA